MANPSPQYIHLWLITDQTGLDKSFSSMYPLCSLPSLSNKNKSFVCEDCYVHYSYRNSHNHSTKSAFLTPSVRSTCYEERTRRESRPAPIPSTFEVWIDIPRQSLLSVIFSTESKKVVKKCRNKALSAYRRGPRAIFRNQNLSQHPAR